MKNTLIDELLQKYAVNLVYKNVLWNTILKAWIIQQMSFICFFINFFLIFYEISVISYIFTTYHRNSEKIVRLLALAPMNTVNC